MSDIRLKTQVLVIGSGIAGASAALAMAERGVEVTLLTADSGPTENNTALAQGGIIYTAPIDPAEEMKRLERDIMVAGWRQNYNRAVHFLARKGPELVREILIDKLGVPFARNQDGTFNLTREGGHSYPRILHCADYTGKAIMESLASAVAGQPNIRLLTRRTAVDLLTTHHHAGHLDYKYNLVNQCVGAYVLHEDSGQVETVLADVTVLATGGAGQIYLHTTNTPSSIGSGLAMAGRAGARLMNAEYVQFHPTALFHKARQRFLISEAVRGEGARLVNSRHEPFMQRYDKRADLAPRDIVTRAIMEEMLATGEPCVYLDAARYVKLDLAERFPTIHRRCLEAGIDMTKDPIPVVPAAHYFCGGVLADIHGRTTLERLYAVGECACTGVHGANRLASTSLLEGLVWGHTAGQDIASRFDRRSILTRKLVESIPDWKSPGFEQNEDPALIAQDWAAIRHTAWNYVGIARTSGRLRRAFEDFRDQNKRIHDFYRETPISKPLIDLFHGCQAAYLITQAALRNTNTLGCHFRAG